MKSKDKANYFWHLPKFVTYQFVLYCDEVTEQNSDQIAYDLCEQRVGLFLASYQFKGVGCYEVLFLNDILLGPLFQRHDPFS